MHIRKKETMTLHIKSIYFTLHLFQYLSHIHGVNNKNEKKTIQNYPATEQFYTTLSW